ncbi:MAG: HU family DNA-binding protein [Christensenellaceae bacterium]|jgi:DNA-binding protein HU-beta|nr:HU family DNA-binding protein [Christensenellaceae bacterium]
MNKTELIAAVAKAAEIKKVDAEKAVNAVLDIVKDTLNAGEKVQLIGFGTFEAKERAARTARNPRTGEEIQVPASRVPSFKASKVFREELNK